MIVVVAWGVAIGLATTGVGAVLGFFTGIAMAFFVAPLIFLLHLSQEQVGTIAWALLGALGLFVVTLVVWGAITWVRGDPHGARGRWASAVSLTSAVLVLKLSADSLVTAWQ